MVGDSVAACPAGDTLSTTVTRPSRLRIAVQYLNNAGSPRVGVPPESVWVSFLTVGGNVKVSDKAFATYADDSTNSQGKCWITIPSVSGCGTLRVTLNVSGFNQGFKNVTIRTADQDASGRVDSADLGPGAQCDLNYSGSVTIQDLQLVIAHSEHWRRLALHGTLVKRTNLCDTCPGHDPNTFGEGRSFWSPNGRWLAYTIHDGDVVSSCNAYIVASDPKDGTSPKKVTHVTTAFGSVYDPTWSPLGHELAYERLGLGLYRKGIVGLAMDTSEVAVITVSGTDRVVYPVYSPDADSLAFSFVHSSAFDLSTIPVAGGSRRTLTANAVTNLDDRYPTWSVDGKIILFDRQDPALSNRQHLYKIPITADPSDGDDAVLFFGPTGNETSNTPFYSPDSQVVVASLGVRVAPISLQLATLETTKSAADVKPIRSNYAPYRAPFLFPVPSPDGTRITLAALDPQVPGAQSSQLFASRRNMNMPPQFTSIGPVSVVDSTAVAALCVSQSNEYYYNVYASDPEGDPIAFSAYYLRSPWMAFSGNQLILAPGGTLGATYNVVLQATTPSGGTDRIIAQITVGCFSPSPARAHREHVATDEPRKVDGPNPTNGEFVVWPGDGTDVATRLRVFDLSGRQIANIQGSGSAPLIWNGRDRDDNAVRPGLYFYHVISGETSRRGRVVVAR